MITQYAVSNRLSKSTISPVTKCGISSFTLWKFLITFCILDLCLGWCLTSTGLLLWLLTCSNVSWSQVSIGPPVHASDLVFCKQIIIGPLFPNSFHGFNLSPNLTTLESSTWSISSLAKLAKAFIPPIPILQVWLRNRPPTSMTKIFDLFL